MEEKRVKTDTSGISIHPPGFSVYYIEWWQIERDGVDWWIRHLSEKNWFSYEIRNEFIDAVYDKLYYHTA